ncbi:hypothetical protein ACI6Q2_22570 [Chitinophagaceae bacterium LWZ2-11]
MGYYLQAFVGKQNDLEIIKDNFSVTVLRELGQGLCLIPMTEQLFDQINNYVSSNEISSFKYLTENVEREILKCINNKELAYVEADYFGGTGSQIGIVWKEGKRYMEFASGQNVINKVLSFLGVISDSEKDEFATLELDKYRNTEDWTENL